MKNFYFAVVKENSPQPDYSYGFWDLAQAVEAVDRLRNRENFPHAYIAVIDKSGEPKLIDELRNFYF